MSTIGNSHAKIKFVRASDTATENLWRVQQATDEAEAKPPKPPDTSKWRCNLCLKTMLSKDSTAHKKGKRHTAAVAKAGNSQSVPATTTIEVEAKPLKPPNESRWTCTLCLTTMSSNDATDHKTGQRHMAAVVKAGNSQPAPTTTTTKTEAEPPSPPNGSRWTCTLCLTSMSSNDAIAHKKGQRHMAAVVKAGNSQSAPTITTTEVEAEPPSPPKESRWTCMLCLTTMSSIDVTAHKKGKRHMAAVVKAGNSQSAPTTATTEVEATPPKTRNESRWTCTLCLTTMSSIDVTAHKKGKRHMAAVAKAGNLQSAPTTTIATEVEAKPPKPPSRLRWCTLCLITMSPNDAKSHKKGKRHMAAVAKAGNSQSAPTTTTTTEVEAKPPKPPSRSRWCTLCLTTISPKEVTTHEKGKRHMAAAAKTGSSQCVPMTTTTTTKVEAEPPSPPNESRWTCTLCLTTMSSSDATAHKKGKRHRAAVVKAGNLQSVPTARPSLQHHSPMPEPGARPTAPDIEETKSLTPVKSPAKAKKKKKKGNTTAKSKKSTKDTVPPSFSADGYDWQGQSDSGSSYDSSTRNTNFNSYNLDWSICDKDCGWCGKCMNGAIFFD